MDSGTPNLNLVAAYVTAILDRARSLELTARQFATADFVAPHTRDLVCAFASIAVAIRAAVVGRWNCFRQSGRKEDFRLLQASDHALRRLAAELRLPARATTDRVPGVLARLVSMKAAQITPEARVTIRPIWNYNYKIRREPIDEKLRKDLDGVFDKEEELNAALRSVPRNLYIVSFPVIERPAVHVHTVIGHELGHLMAAKAPRPTSIQEKLMEAARQRAVGAAERRNSGIETGGEPTESAAPETFDEEIERAVNAFWVGFYELAADAAAILLFGIPVLLGAVQIALSGDIKLGAKLYPVWAVRIVEMYERAHKEGWLEFSWATEHKSTELRDATESVKRRIDDIHTWAEASRPRDLHSDGWIALGHRFAKEAVASTVDYFKSDYSHAIANAKNVYRAVPTLYERLRQGLPPDSVSTDESKPKPAALADIFAAAWWYRIHDLRPAFNEADQTPEFQAGSDRIQRLAFKAIENVDFLERFSSAAAAAYGHA